MTEDFAKYALLYDFYGELLSERQRKIYEAYAYNDLSLSEISDSFGISRQAASTMIGRCRKALLEYESSLHMADKFAKIERLASDIHNLASSSEGELAKNITKLSEDILQEIS